MMNRKEYKLLVEGWKLFLREGSSQNNKLFFLIGPPGIGKSFWVKENLNDPYIISLDDETERIAGKYGLSYDDMFLTPSEAEIKNSLDNPEYEHPKYGRIIDQQITWKTWAPKVWEKINNAELEVLENHEKKIQNAKNSGSDVVIDMTNMNLGGRERIKDQLALSDYRTVGVVFHWEEEGVSYLDDLKNIARNRSEEYKRQGKSKTIPDAAYDRMTSSYQGPLADEFDEIIDVPVSANAIGHYRSSNSN